MFSNNGEISNRQTKRLLIFDMLGITTVLLPKVLAKYSGSDGIFALLVGMLLAIVYLHFIEKLDKKGLDIFSILKKKKSGFWEEAVRLFYLFLFLGLAGYVTYLQCSMIQTVLVKDESFYLLAVCVLVLAGYGIRHGLEGRARIYEVLYWFLLIPFLAMLLFACKDVKADYWCPIFFSGTENWLKSAFTVFMFFHIGCLTFLIQGQGTKKKKSLPARLAVGITGLWNMALYLILLGVFQCKMVAAEDYSAVVLMSMVRLPGGFLKRQDAFMMAIWFFSLYALLNACVYQGSVQLKHITGENGQKRYTVLMCIAVYFLAVLFFHNKEALYCFTNRLAPMGVFLSCIIILIIKWKSKEKKE